jgi:signal transduction histidine kinase
LLFILADVVDRGRAVAEERLAQVVNQFSRENKLFEQKLWVAQHVWYTLLHGTVQSALTTAAIRAGGKNQLTASDQEAIVQDLNRAIVALRNPQAKDVIFEKSLLELQQTWSGICSVETKVDPEVLTALAGLADARLITNEVVKEAVSNAVKHGGATQATINLSLSADREILVNVSNNGAAPRPGAGAGIGTSIFDAVCLNYELTRDTSSELTQFQARIPLA